MAIVMNQACPKCQETGHDHRGNHLMVFEDGARFCNRVHWHRDGMPVFIPPDGEDPILEMEVNGTIKYTAEQFRDLLKEGKFENPQVRVIALSGMRAKTNGLWLPKQSAKPCSRIERRTNLTSRNSSCVTL